MISSSRPETARTCELQGQAAKKGTAEPTIHSGKDKCSENMTTQKHNPPNRPKSLFEELPGEIRNRIYQCVYKDEQTVIIRPKGPLFDGHPLSSSFLGKPTVPKAQRCLSIKTGGVSRAAKALICHKRPGGKPLPAQTIEWSSSPISLLLTCKSISDEAAGFLYANALFFFEDTARLNAFIKTSRSKNLFQVQKLSIFVQAYGIPCAKADTQWEYKHIARWVNTLKAVTEAMPNVSFLRLNLHSANVSGFLGRAFRTKNPDLGPLLIPQALSGLAHLKRISVHTSSQLLACSRNTDLMNDMYGPHFEVQGIYRPSTLQKEIVFLANKIKAQELHDALNSAIKKMIRGDVCDVLVDEERVVEPGWREQYPWSSELGITVKDWQQWATDPVGNSLRAAGPLPPQGMHFPIAQANAPANPPANPHNQPSTTSNVLAAPFVPVPAPVSAPVNAPQAASTARPRNRSNKPRRARQTGQSADTSAPPAPAPMSALLLLTLEMSTPITDPVMAPAPSTSPASRPAPAAEMEAPARGKAKQHQATEELRRSSTKTKSKKKQPTPTHGSESANPSHDQRSLPTGPVQRAVDFATWKLAVTANATVAASRPGPPGTTGPGDSAHGQAQQRASARSENTATRGAAVNAAPVSSRPRKQNGSLLNGKVRALRHDRW